MALVGQEGELLGTGLTTPRTLGLLTQTKRLILTFCNHDTVSRAVTAHLVEKGGTAGNSNMIVQEASDALLKAKETRSYVMDQVLNPEDFIRWKADAASKVSARITLEEQASSTSLIGGGSETGPSATQGKAIELPTALTKAHVVASGMQGIFASFVLLNRDTVRRGVEIQYVPNGQGTADRYRIVLQGSDTLLHPGETRIFQLTQVLNSGDMIWWKATVANKITGRVSIQEASA